jgi:catechol 2,3-dioxygenase-like lactoylglutathione lyase family enzyme
VTGAGKTQISRMSRGLDHIVHAVRDLDAAAEFYRRAGFTVGARNRHAWGTHNYIVQFPGVFIELITIGEPELIRAGGPGTFSFGTFTRDFLAREQGLAMLVLEGKGAAGDIEAFRAAGIGNFKPFNFEREARRPDGTPVKVAFSLVFAADEKAPDVGYFTCQQHHPENFWNPAFQTHSNGAVGIDGVVMVAANPQDHRHFVGAFSGVSDVVSSASGISVMTPRGEIQVMNPSAYRAYAGTNPPDLARGAHLAAIRFAVRDKTKAISSLKEGGTAVVERNGSVVVAPDAAFGATLIFESPKQG